MNLEWLLKVLMFPFEIKTKLEDLKNGKIELNEVYKLVIQSFFMTIILLSTLFVTYYLVKQPESVPCPDVPDKSTELEKRWDALQTELKNTALIDLNTITFKSLEIGDKTLIDKPESISYPIELFSLSNKKYKPASSFYETIRFEKKGDRWEPVANNLTKLGENISIKILGNEYQIRRGRKTILFETEDLSYRDDNGVKVRRNSVYAGHRNIYTYNDKNNLHILKIRNANLTDTIGTHYIEFEHYLLTNN